MTSEEFLEHHGIKGMHWGVRRAERARANSDRMQEIARQRPTSINVVAARRIKKKADRLELKQKRKLNKYGDKSVRRLTPAQIQARHERNTRRIRFGATVAIGAMYIAANLAAMKQQPPSSWRLRDDAPKVAKTVKDLINEERDTQMSSLIRTHKEGHITKDQLDNFMTILNKRYDRKLKGSGG